MESVKDFDILLCGEPTTNMYELKIVMDNLAAKIAKMTQLIVDFSGDIDKASIEIPFYGRSVLEAAFTGLLGRFDPFRVITVYKVQSDPSYDLGKKALSAVEWSNDIMAKNRSANLWSFENKKENFDRALLGNHVGEIIWKPAFNALSDFIGSRTFNSDWLNEILAENEEANFQKSKSIAGRMFSAFSKGIHSESLVDIHEMLDPVTLIGLIVDTYKLCATLGLVSHFVGFLVPTIEPERALNIFFGVEELIGNVQL